MLPHTRPGIVSVPSISALLVSDGGQCQMVIGWHVLAPASGSGFAVSGARYFSQAQKTRFGFKATSIVAIAIYAGLVWAVPLGAVVASGSPAKTLGCPSCHNPMMGQRQALPPAKMGEYYKVERQRQVNLGGYNIGSEDTQDHAGGSYKDANWQLRHFDEPTMTW